MPLKKFTEVKEDLLLSKDDDVNIEILEERIIKFNNFKLSDILETLKTKYSDTDYFIRKKDNDLHIVKYNENLKLDVNQFVNSLLKVYSTKPELKKILEGIKVKGNMNFCIIENLKYSDKVVNDLSKLLTNKKN